MLAFYENQGLEKGYQKTTSPDFASTTLVYGREVTLKELRGLAADTGLDYNVLSDTLDAQELPRVEQQKDTEYVFVRDLEVDKAGIHGMPTLLITRPHFFAYLTRSGRGQGDMVKDTIEKKHQVVPSLLLIDALTTVVKRYEAFIDQTGEAVGKTKRRLRSHEVTNNDFIQFVTVEENLNSCKRNLTGIAAVVDRLCEISKHERDKELISDIGLFIKQLLVDIESHAQSIVSIRNAYMTIANNTLNQRMKTLTALTLLVALPNVFYGMFGMNVGLPFADEPWAYLAIVCFTIVLVVVTYTLAKKLKLW